jgi:UDP-glucuronate decarboxylase
LTTFTPDVEKTSRISHGLDIKVACIFNTYRPRMHPNDGRVVSNFILQAFKGDAITIYGDGSQTRSVCCVDELIEAMVRLMATERGFTGPVNIGNPTVFTILQLARLVLQLTGSSSSLVLRELPSDDPKQRQPDIRLAQTQLAWEPRVSLEEGLRRTIEYFGGALEWT